MPSIPEAVVALALGVLLLLLGTLAFDVLHVLLHRWLTSRWSLLRRLAGLHEVHHQFLDRDLHIHEDLIRANVFCHVIPEYLVQVGVTVGLGLLLQLPLPAIVVALALETLVFGLIMKPTPGFDVNHRPVDRLRAYRPQYFCLPEYHLLHHVYPDAYFGSWLKTLDHLLATGTAIEGRKVALTGGGSECGQALRRGLLSDSSIVEVDDSLLDNKGELARVLQDADILVLCHADDVGTSYRDIIELYHGQHQERRVPVEVWAVSGPDEFRHNSPFATYAKALFRAGKVIYRHLVIPSDPSPADLSALQRRIRQGYNYVAARWDAATCRHCLHFLAK
jgi:hypothetical protein